MKTLIKTSSLEEILDFMEEGFDGDLDTISKQASQKAEAEGMIYGPLWEEIGSQTMKHLFKMRRLHPGRRSISRLTEQQENKDVPAYENKNTMAWWVSLRGKWYNLLDLYKEDVEELASCYDKLAKTNGFERDFYSKVASKLENGQPVGQIFDIEALKELRKEV